MKTVTSVLLMLLLCSCGGNMDQTSSADITEQLSKDAALETIAGHLLKARQNAGTTRALALHFPDMDKETGFKIQNLALQLEESSGERLLGWKMGGTTSAPAAPVFGYSTTAHSFKPGESIPADLFVNKACPVEAEICFILGKDLPGPAVSREELVTAVESVAGAIELISVRAEPVSAEKPETKTLAHTLADNASHGGAILGEVRLSLDEIDLRDEGAVARLAGVEKARGSSARVMNGDPLAALLWLANELPKHGRHLRAGDFVVTGSLFENPVIKAGESIEIEFTNLGKIAVGLK
jgi:2-keto-4-pentenoate hydratase